MLFLVHHADAVDATVDPQRPLSDDGRRHAERLASRARDRQVKPAVIWHSGKLRSRQTAELFWRACNPLAEFQAVPGLQPADFPGLFRTQLIGEPRDVMGVGHMPNLPRVLGLLTTGSPDAPASFPAHGIVALERATADTDGLWIERWRIESPIQTDEHRLSM